MNKSFKTPACIVACNWREWRGTVWQLGHVSHVYSNCQLGTGYSHSHTRLGRRQCTHRST
eukprot:2043380-Prymnesium_polylepis.1